MNKIEQMKFSNEISIKVLKNEFPINGTTRIFITMKNGQPESVDIKNTKKKEA